MRRFAVLDAGVTRFRLGSARHGRVHTWAGVAGDPFAYNEVFAGTIPEATAHLDRLVAAWIPDGYAELPEGAMSLSTDDGERTLAQVLADAVADDPDDLAAVMAEADYLAEQGDPRGEFVQVQLALEDATRSADCRHTWARGRLDTFECRQLTVNAARRLGSHPLARCLRVFRVESDMVGSGQCAFAGGPDLPSLDWFDPVEVLRHHPAARNLRVFQYGRSPDPEADEYAEGATLGRLSPLLSAMPRLEELYLFGRFEDDAAKLFALPTLSRLRVLHHYHGDHYPLEALAENPTLTKLTHLLCFPHSFATRPYEDRWRPTLNLARLEAVAWSPYLRSLTHLQLRCCDAGDLGVEALIASGMLGRLKWLDLRHGHITDEGPKMLASYDEAKGLEVIDLVNNRLTEAGVEALRRAGVRVRAERQQEPPYNDDAIMYYGDGE